MKSRQEQAVLSLMGSRQHPGEAGRMGSRERQPQDVLMDTAWCLLLSSLPVCRDICKPQVVSLMSPVC